MEKLFKAVSFVSSMRKKGTPVGLAIHKAAKYYGVEESLVASEFGKRGKGIKKNIPKVDLSNVTTDKVIDNILTKEIAGKMISFYSEFI